MCLGEHVFNLFTGLDIPVRYLMGFHVLLPFRPLLRLDLALCHRSLAHRLHDFEGFLRLHALVDQVGHDVVTGTHTGGNGGNAIPDQILGVAQPYVRTMGKSRDSDQIRKGFGLSFDDHAHGKIRTKLRDTQTAKLCTTYLLRCDAQSFRILEQAHDLRSVQGNGQRIPSGHILQHTDHGGIIVSQNVKLQQVMVNGMIVKVSGNGIRGHIVGGMLYRRKRIDILPQGQHYDTAGVLSGTAPYSHTSRHDAVNLAVSLVFSPFFKVVLHISECRLIRQRRYGSRAEGLSRAKDNLRIFMSLGLILSGEVQVDIRLLVSLEAKEGLEGDVKAFLM